jgi:hypothetical protein
MQLCLLPGLRIALCYLFSYLLTHDLDKETNLAVFTVGLRLTRQEKITIPNNRAYYFPVARLVDAQSVREQPLMS